MIEKTLYHFTHPAHLPVILTDQVLRPSESNFDPYAEHAGPDVVWLTDLPVIQPVEDHPLTMGLTEEKRRVRFEVIVPAIRWLDWLPVQSMHPAWRATLIETGGGIQVAESWYVLPAPIRSTSWVEVRHDGKPVFTNTQRATL